MSHNWSGWPGSYCTKCLVEHALENAIGMGWFDPGHPGDGTTDNPPQEERWLSDVHRQLVHLCDSNCAADMTPEAFLVVKAQALNLEKEIKEWEKKQQGATA